LRFKKESGEIIGHSFSDPTLWTDVYSFIIQLTGKSDWQSMFVPIPFWPVLSIFFVIVIFGYPPKKHILLYSHTPVSNMGLCEGDVLALFSSSTLSSVNPKRDKEYDQESVSEESKMVVIHIPDDNSCLFNSIGYVLENHSLCKSDALRNRKIVVDLSVSHVL
jgi:hypothetical protein